MTIVTDSDLQYLQIFAELEHVNVWTFGRNGRNSEGGGVSKTEIGRALGCETSCSETQVELEHAANCQRL